MESILDYFTREQVETLKKIADNPIFKKSQPIKITKNTKLKDLRSEICEQHNITVEEFTSRRKDAGLVKARTEFVKIAIKLKNADSSKIADVMNKDRQMVCYYLRKPTPETIKILDKYKND